MIKKITSTTEDCVKLITQNPSYKLGSWKRVKKYNQHTTVVRYFVNNEYPDLFLILTDWNGDIEVHERPKFKTLKECIAYSIKIDSNYKPNTDKEDFSLVFYYLMETYSLKVPEVRYEGQTEELDFENYSFISYNENELHICAGGDWQEPLYCKFYIKEGFPVMEKLRPGCEDTMITNEEVIEYYLS